MTSSTEFTPNEFWARYAGPLDPGFLEESAAESGAVQAVLLYGLDGVLRIGYDPALSPEAVRRLAAECEQEMARFDNEGPLAPWGQLEDGTWALVMEAVPDEWDVSSVIDRD